MISVSTLLISLLSIATALDASYQPLETKDVRRLKDRPPTTHELPDTSVELGRFSQDGVSFRFDEDSHSVIVESKFKLRGNSARSMIGEPRVEKINPINMPKEMFREWNNDGDDIDLSAGSIPDHLAVHRARPEPESTGSARNVFGSDDRQVFRDTSFPYSTIGRTSSGCTGTMVGRRHVLTAAHCLRSGQMSFTPAYFDGDAPFGVAFVTAIVEYDVVDTSDGFYNSEVAFDYAVLVLDRDMGDLTGWLGYRTYSTSWNDGLYWDNIGYPSGLTGNQRPVISYDGAFWMAETYQLGDSQGMVLGHFIDSEPGHSGGPFWGYWGSESSPRVVAVQSSASFDPAFTASGDNQAAGGPAMTDLINYAKSVYP